MTVVFSPQSDSSPKASPVSLLPLLVVLFIVSYAILTLLVVEQGRTIESQRSLVHEMLQDSSQLAALKHKLADNELKQSQGKAAAEAEEKDPASGNSTAAPKKHDKDPRPHGKSARPHKVVPGKPASDLEDVRRSTRVI